MRGPEAVKDRTVELALEVQLAHGAVIEDEAQPVAANHLDLTDLVDAIHGRGSIAISGAPARACCQRRSSA